VGVRITLTPQQADECIEHGKLVDSESRRLGTRDKYGLKTDAVSSLEEDIDSCCREKAASIVYGVKWNKTINTFKEIPDIGERTDVRGRKDYLPHYHLIIRDDDPDDRYYVFVAGGLPCLDFYVVGHVWGDQNIRRGKFLKAPNGRPPAWFVPMELLSEPPKNEKACHLDSGES
jgi:hypothetical protein